MGNDELTRLWNLNHNNMAACQSVSREFMPTLEEFFEEAIEQADLANMEDEYKVVRNSNWLASPASCLGVPTSSSPPTSSSRAWLTTWRWSSNWPRSCLSEHAD